jgi:hypothetical protein
MKQPEVWERYARAIIKTGRRPHFAPSDEILAIQRERVSGFVASRGAGCLAVILGATPELADIALTAGCRVVRVDSNPSMFDAAAGRQYLTDRSNETIAIGNWLNLHMIGDGAADIVLGDCSLNNVPHEDMKELIVELARIAHPGSMLALRQIILPDTPIAGYEFSAAVAAFRAGRISDNEFHWMLRFYSFTACAYDLQTHVLDARRVFAEISRRHMEGGLTDAEHDFLMTRYSEIRHTVYAGTEQRRLLESLGSCEVVPPGRSCSRDLFGVFVVNVR